MAGKFVVSKRNDGDFQFNLKAGNGQVILTSQGYGEKRSCLDGIESVRTSSADDGRYVREVSGNGKWYFNLRAGNGQVIGTSQMYDSEAGRDNGIDSVKNHAAGAEVVDEST